MILPMIFSGFRSLLSWSNCVSGLTLQGVLSPDLLKAMPFCPSSYGMTGSPAPSPQRERWVTGTRTEMRKGVAQKQCRARD